MAVGSKRQTKPLVTEMVEDVLPGLQELGPDLCVGVSWCNQGLLAVFRRTSTRRRTRCHALSKARWKHPSTPDAP